MSRRGFLAWTGAGAVALTVRPGLPVVAGEFGRDDVGDHFVPLDKKLDPTWIRELFAAGGPVWRSKDELAYIGMPIGGVAAGQVYLTGDGRLVYWDIFNNNFDTGAGAHNYQAERRPETMIVRGPTPAPRVLQGCAIRIDQDGQSVERTLDADGFANLEFCGEYPIGRVRYRDNACPVAVDLEAFSPFIPLNADDSSLPATVLRYTIKNTSQSRVDVRLAGWLQNSTAIFSADELFASTRRVNRRADDERCVAVVGGLEVSPRKGERRPPEVFADFEGSDYGDWEVEGEAFGDAPAMGTLYDQQTVSGYRGERLVNSYIDRDGPTGRMRSPEFTISRDYINLLVGGGGHAERTCVNLFVDGKVVRTATGRFAERLFPVAWRVDDLAGRRATIEIVDQASGGWGHINVDRIEFADQPMSRELGELRRRPDVGTMAIALIGGADAQSIASIDVEQLATSALAPREAGPDAATAAMDRPLVGAVARSLHLAPGEEATATIVVSWFMPNLYKFHTWELGDGSGFVGQHYARRFASALDVVRYIAENYDRLSGETVSWHRTYYDSTLPRWLLDRIGATVCNLATNTCQWWRNGRFWAWEGVGCCAGTCGHVWNYAQALARLFPQLERSVREMQDFVPGVGMNGTTGQISFRGENWGMWAADAQAGYVLKAYREHQCSADDAFLNRNWRWIRKTLQFLIEQDGDQDGLIEGMQHQTYDQEYYGANTFVGSLYLAALRAGEEMAREVGDEDFALLCRQLFEAGRDGSVERLFNGEYFIQDVDLKEHPHQQYGDGCLADQLFGQTWAEQVDLGRIYPAEQVRAALGSIWNYCWTPDIEAQNKAHAPERWFAMPGEAGLFICTWPKSPHGGPKSMRYRDEVWTGIEYQVASNMAAEGMLTESLAICRAIHERYGPAKRNPYNEVECGDHYARALASWGMIISLSGFSYHGPRGSLGFAPKLRPEEFRAPFTTAEGWGTFDQRIADQRLTAVVDVRYGALAINELRLQLPADVAANSVEVGGQQWSHFETTGRDLKISFPSELRIDVGKQVVVSVQLA